MLVLKMQTREVAVTFLIAAASAVCIAEAASSYTLKLQGGAEDVRSGGSVSWTPYLEGTFPGPYFGLSLIRRVPRKNRQQQKPTHLLYCNSKSNGQKCTSKDTRLTVTPDWEHNRFPMTLTDLKPEDSGCYTWRLMTFGQGDTQFVHKMLRVTTDGKLYEEPYDQTLSSFCSAFPHSQPARPQWLPPIPETRRQQLRARGKIFS